MLQLAEMQSYGNTTYEMIRVNCTHLLIDDIYHNLNPEVPPTGNVQFKEANNRTVVFFQM